MPHEGIPRLLRVILGKSVFCQTCLESPRVVWEYFRVSPEFSIGMCQVRMSLFQRLIWKFFPSGAQKIQTVLQPSASGQSGFFGLLQERISILVPPSAGRMLHTIDKNE